MRVGEWGFHESATNESIAIGDKIQQLHPFGQPLLASPLIKRSDTKLRTRIRRFQSGSRVMRRAPLFGVSKYTYRKFDGVRRLGRITRLN
jgi:hypothetical protein